ncbi:hypothetical protein EV360DRAFT_68727 [Lentinula raphanica]|nr:hypothetical protein EV360DRAFT_68727 [Lentinula raphanica]
MSAFNRVYLSLSLFMFFVVLGAITSPLAAAKPPTDRVWNPGIAPDLYKLLKIVLGSRNHWSILTKIYIGGLTTRMRLRRRKSWPDGEDLVTLAKMSPLVSPTEHWTLYFGETIAYDFLIHKTLYAIVSAKATTKSHVKTPWDRDGRLGLIVFSTMEKVTTFKELHDQLSTHAQGYNNVSFYSNILGFLVQRHRNGKIKKLDVNYEWWYALLIPMVRGCGNGTGYLEKDCNKLPKTNRRPLVQFTTQDPSPQWQREGSLSSSTTWGTRDSAATGSLSREISVR